MDACRPPAYAGGRSGEGDALARRKRRWVVVGVDALVAVATFMLWPRTDPAIREKCDQLRAGMTMAEAEAILGRPGDYTTRFNGCIPVSARGFCRYDAW